MILAITRGTAAFLPDLMVGGQGFCQNDFFPPETATSIIVANS